MTLPEQESERIAIRVVAALIQREDGRVLITQRHPMAFMPLKWEFPGGKVEPGETDQEALAREIKEELGIDLRVGEHYMGLLHRYPDFDVDFHVYRGDVASGKIAKISVHDFQWVEVSDLESYDFPPADQPTVEQLLAKK